MGERRARERERGGWGEGKETREGCNLKLSLLASEYLKKLIPAISNAPGKHKSVHIISRTIIFHQEKIHRLGEPYRDPPSILQRVSSDSQLLKFGRAGESQYSPAIYLDDCSCSDLATGANQLINPATTIMNNSWFQRSNSFINCGRRSHRAPLRFQIPAQKMKKKFGTHYPDEVAEVAGTDLSTPRFSQVGGLISRRYLQQLCGDSRPLTSHLSNERWLMNEDVEHGSC